MFWLNWSLKLHIRLRTISYLITSTSHMSMFNECLIHLCDCTWLNVMYIFKHLLIKLKKIFEYFSCFWKVFWFEKISQKSKNLQLCILTTHSRVTSFMLQSRAQPEAFATIWRMKVLIAKKTYKIFSKYGFKDFWRLIRKSQAQPKAFTTHSQV